METSDNTKTAEHAEGSSERHRSEIETADHAEGRFKYREIHQYLRGGLYPEEYSKTDKAALRKRAKFFTCDGSDLFYVGGVSSMLTCVHVRVCECQVH